MPDGASRSVSIALLTCLGLGGLIIGVAVDSLILKPARLQREFLGAQIASPMELRSYSESGFQDPMKQWFYELSRDKVESLKPRCTPDRHAGRPDVCALYSESDERWFVSISLEGDQLRIDEGLW